jgi:2-methylisocitrate lyase-like PEP mutase family enzyme
MNKLKQFQDLHQQASPLILGNVWDAHSVQLAEAAGFQALGSSSHAIANALGYEDGEEMSPAELLFMVERMLRVSPLPLSVDFESGYSDDPHEVAEQVKKLVDLGVVGINLEDGKVVDGKRELGDPALLADKIAAIKSKTSLFINARTDTYVTKHAQALEESIKRAEMYAQAGADGIFVPKMESEKDITTFTKQIALPLNLFYSPTLPKADTLAKWEVKRLSHGASLYTVMMEFAEKGLTQFIQKGVLPTVD